GTKESSHRLPPRRACVRDRGSLDDAFRFKASTEGSPNMLWRINFGWKKMSGSDNLGEISNEVAAGGQTCKMGIGDPWQGGQSLKFKNSFYFLALHDRITPRA